MIGSRSTIGQPGPAAIPTVASIVRRRLAVRTLRRTAEAGYTCGLVCCHQIDRASSQRPFERQAAFSGGQIEEFIAFTNYLAQGGMRPSLVIVVVDGFNFLESGRDPSSIPDYIVKQEARPGFLKAYMSMDSLRMTWRTLINDSSLPRYYDSQFAAQIKHHAPRFQPSKTLEGEGLRRADAKARSKILYSTHNAEQYKKLAKIFPNAQTVAYVPPISAWHVARMEKNGVLAGYIDAIYATAARFPIFMDFSIPSPITWRTDNTYDGSHYRPDANRSIALTLLGSTALTWGLDPKSISAGAYHPRYQEALDHFRNTVPGSTD
jgi:hypothetical protein